MSRYIASTLAATSFRVLGCDWERNGGRAPKRRVVSHQEGSEDGDIVYSDNDQFQVFENLDELRRHATWYREANGESDYLSRVLQRFEHEFGQAPTPRMLDI